MTLRCAMLLCVCFERACRRKENTRKLISLSGNSIANEIPPFFFTSLHRLRRSHELLITSVSKYIILVLKKKRKTETRKYILIKVTTHKINICTRVKCRKVNTRLIPVHILLLSWQMFGFYMKCTLRP